MAGRFGLKPETILWGNPLLSENAEALRIGTVINILPVDGVLHYVGEGDTVERIQLLYGVPIEDFVAYPGNNFPDEPPYTLTPGQKVIVPGGRKPIVWQEPGPRVIAGRGRRSPGYFSGPLVKFGTGSFIWPVPPDVITQYYWAGHPGIDIDTYLGQPIVASDSGTAIFSGWDDTGFGYLVIVDHGNDFWTYYGHNSQNLVSAGQGVDKGQTIALSGSTGNSTGDHIDFRIRYQAGAFVDPMLLLP
ncbi:MAG: peptidoglycan DD-metalloendopeptidase family protein [Chloroflexi bacterium]|nr:peptidoglycan DD-metalloendopeptidase family protein [Chloroflexota bacterium]